MGLSCWGFKWIRLQVGGAQLLGLEVDKVSGGWGST